MAVVKMHPKGQIVIPKEIRTKLGVLKPGKVLSITFVKDHAEIRLLPDDPIEFLTGFFEGHPVSLSEELLKERKQDNITDENNSL
ncbi:MAG: AbrB/MazE/SpoVT family DNA-binding domain-containing protein [Candidatus Zixiibacteriota bacterium]|jgi:AbrB family looped-hinge helix DNA binding protein